MAYTVYILLFHMAHFLIYELHGIYKALNAHKEKGLKKALSLDFLS